MKEEAQSYEVPQLPCKEQDNVVKALIFDMDGTLVDSEKLHFDAWRDILRGYGVKNFGFDEFVSYIGASNEKLAQDYIDKAGLAVGVTEMVGQKQELYLEMIPSVKPLPGVMRSVRAFADHYRLAVASSSDCIELEKILTTLGIRHLFEKVVGGDTVVMKKPHPEIYLKTAGLLGLAPDKCLAFEDSESGITAAKSANMFAIAIPNGLSKLHDFSRADRVIERMDMADETLLTSVSKR